MSATPKPCPFCGSRALVRAAHVWEGITETWVECSSCFASTDRVEAAYSEPEQAVALWNARTPNEKRDASTP